MDLQHIKIIEGRALTVVYQKSLQEKIKTINKILIERVKNILCVNIEYTEATSHSPTQVQISQKLESIEFLPKEQCQ